MAIAYTTSSLWPFMVPILLLITFASAKTYYASPTCHEGDVSCMTLSQYATKPKSYFAHNITLILLPGSHSLESELVITHKKDLAIFSSLPNTTVSCSQNESARFKVRGIDCVTIGNITFVSCTNNKFKSIGQFSLHNCNICNGSGLTLELVASVTILTSNFHLNEYYSNEFNDGALNDHNNDVVSQCNCSFFGNNFETINEVQNNKEGDGIGGIVNIFNSSVTIDSCSFVNNTSERGRVLYIESSIISIHNSNFISNTGAVYAVDSDVSITLSTFINNRANGPGGAVYGYVVDLAIDLCTFTDNHANQSGGAIYVVEDAYVSESDVSLRNSSFVNNKVHSGSGGAVYIMLASNATFENTLFSKNVAHTGTGGAIYYMARDATMYINDSYFTKNRAGGFAGGAVYALGGVWDSTVYVIIANTVFSKNNLSGHGEFLGHGGAVSIMFSDVTLLNTTFRDCNSLYNISLTDKYQVYGGAVSVMGGEAVVENSMFVNNKAVFGGGLYVVGSHVTINNTKFKQNIAGNMDFLFNGVGGAIGVDSESVVTIDQSVFIYNQAGCGGGAVYMTHTSGYSSKSALNVINTNFIHNTACSGAAIYVERSDFSGSDIDIQSNHANSSVVFILQSVAFFSGTTTVSYNTGSLLAFNSNITLSGNTTIENNSCNSVQTNVKKGGAITSFLSNLYFLDSVNLLNNTAEYGGAILATDSKIDMHGNVKIASNRAQSGGGIYAFQTELIFGTGTQIIEKNVAEKKGGGMYCISSLTKLLYDFLNFTSNSAEMGGGVCLELNSKLYILKPDYEYCDNFRCSIYVMIDFTENSADYGGAVYVTDDTNSGTCDSGTPSAQLATSECFFQVLASYSTVDLTKNNLSKDSLGPNFFNFNFIMNKARFAGQTLFGGLLDRCTVSPFAEIFLRYYHNLTTSNQTHAATYFLTVTNFENYTDSVMDHEVESKPVRVCFCNLNGHPDCSYQLPPVRNVTKGELFSVQVVAVDHINNTVNSTIRTYLSTGHGGLKEGQDSQKTYERCTNLTYNVVSYHDNETLFLYAEGPCNNTGLSRNSIEIKFLPCPIGFSYESKLGHCECNPNLLPYITHCDIDSQSVLRESDFWIAYWSPNNSNESTKGFIKHQHCPYDYCRPSTEKIYIDFNIPNGTDAQCIANRTGTLCGSCKKPQSVLFGSSRCALCSNEWLLLVLLFAIAGVALVVFLLVFNLTVAVGAINGLIFYANIIAANRAIFLPFDKPGFSTIFIAWFNLDIGFETCFYDRMDGYAKVWLQFVFPFYIILLVILVIIVCEYSRWVSQLLSRTNPVATLATLILLSYAKLLRTTIVALTFTKQEYPDGSHKKLWLFDANITYLEGKHIWLFAIALLILSVGLVYTILLTFWQFFLHIKLADWLRNNHEGLYRWYNIRVYRYLYSFMDVYHAPYNTSHRYWTGLLLLLLGSLYLISAVLVPNNPNVSLLSTICVVLFLLLWKLITIRIYKTDFLNNLDTICIINLGVFTVGTTYLRATAESKHQVALANTSTSIALLTFISVLFYHARGVPQHLYNMFLKRKTEQRQIEQANNRMNVEDAGHGTAEECTPLLCSQTEVDGLPDRCESSTNNHEKSK